MAPARSHDRDRRHVPHSGFSTNPVAKDTNALDPRLYPSLEPVRDRRPASSMCSRTCGTSSSSWFTIGPRSPFILRRLVSISGPKRRTARGRPLDGRKKRDEWSRLLSPRTPFNEQGSSQHGSGSPRLNQLNRRATLGRTLFIITYRKALRGKPGKGRFGVSRKSALRASPESGENKCLRGDASETAIDVPVKSTARA